MFEIKTLKEPWWKFTKWYFDVKQGKWTVLKTFDVKVQVHSVPEYFDENVLKQLFS